jgi:hypothetical protein
MREVLKDAVFIGSVTDLRGEELRAWRTPDGNVIIAGDRGSLLTFTPGPLGEFRDLLDRAAMPGQAPRLEPAVIIEGTVTPEDLVRANMREARFPVGTAAAAQAARDEAERWAEDFAAACRAQDPLALGDPEHEENS